MNSIAEVADFVTHLHTKYRDLDEGEIATYIPELGKANPEHFSISVATAGGEVFSVGDAQQTFTIQSICKPLAFLIALEVHGRDQVLSMVGVEPSGDAFNAIELNPRTNRPFNPMVNSGAIAIASLIRGDSPEAGVKAFVDRLSRAAGRTLQVDEAVYASESATGNRNRAIAWLLRNFAPGELDVEHTLHQYFAQCSVLINSADLAMIGATLANVGQNPISHDAVFEVHYLRDALAAMFTCGMYDYAGEWAYRVGMPAKSGVSGGIVAVVNRQLAIAVYSPRLDDRGNSVRGIKVCADLAEEFGLHAFDFMNFGSSLLRTL